MDARLGVTEKLLTKIESDDVQSLELRRIVMAFSADVGASPIRTMALLRRQVRHPIDEFSYAPASSRKT
ncbi:hypothetical protein [Kitasatospora sp. NPDC006786]|uniref:hypothetical protein n=1 Tax=unclassified Kitasatospora TaxID=2633591 RepID=UPI00340993B4